MAPFYSLLDSQPIQQIFQHNSASSRLCSTLLQKFDHARQGVPKGEFWGQLPPNAGKNFGGGPLDSISKDAVRTNHNFTPSTPIHRAAVFLYTQSLGREVEYAGRPTSIST